MSTVEKWGWASVVGALGAALCLGALLLVMVSGLDSGKNQAIAAWVQAVGSIGAIAAGGWFIRYQSAIAVRNKRRAILAILDLALESMGGSTPIPEDDEEALNRFGHLEHEKLQFAHDSLAAIPLHEIDLAHVISGIAEAKELLRVAINLHGPDRLGLAYCSSVAIKNAAATYRKQFSGLLTIRCGVEKVAR